MRRLRYIEPFWFCAGCEWRFQPPPFLEGVTLEELIARYEAFRDDSFAKHRCEDY